MKISLWSIFHFSASKSEKFQNFVKCALSLDLTLAVRATMIVIRAPIKITYLNVITLTFRLACDSFHRKKKFGIVSYSRRPYDA